MNTSDTPPIQQSGQAKPAVSPFFLSHSSAKLPATPLVTVLDSDSDSDKPLAKLKDNKPSPVATKDVSKHVIVSRKIKPKPKQNGGKIPVASDRKSSSIVLSSDSDADVPLAKLSSMKKMPTPSKGQPTLIHTDSLGAKQKMTQKTLFEMGTKFDKAGACIANVKPLHSLFPSKPVPIRPAPATGDAVIKPDLQFPIMPKKVDDLELENLQALPAPHPVDMPEGLLHSFGDVVMIVEFIHTFRSFFCPEETLQISADDLKNALGGGANGAETVSKVLLVLLKILLIDEEDSKVSDYNLSLVDLPLTTFTMSDVLYRFLQVKYKGKTTTESDDDEEYIDDDEEEDRIPTSCSAALQKKPQILKKVMHELKSKEFYLLSGHHQLMVLVYLFNEVMDSDEFTIQFRDIDAEISNLWKESDALRRERKSKQVVPETKVHKEEGIQKLEVCFGKAISPGGQDGPSGKEAATPDSVPSPVVEVGLPSADEQASTSDAAVGSPIEESNVTENVSDLVSLMRQRRILSMKQAVWKEEQEKKDKERRIKLQEENLHFRKINSIKDGIQRCRDMRRAKPLGQDRYHRLYWLFNSQFSGLYVEDGWFYNGNQREVDSWYRFESVKEVDTLISSLAVRGIRESSLKSVLKSQYKSIISKVNNGSRSIDSETTVNHNAEAMSISALKEDIIESGQRIIKGTLGELQEFDVWEENVNKASNREELVPLIIALKRAVFSKCLQGALVTEKALANWQRCVETSVTLSSLHSLFGIFENSIKWESSIENAKCKVCRKKSSDVMTVCDTCSHVYHIYCVRPAIDYLPPRGWQCSACKPPEKRGRRSRNIYEESEEIKGDDEPESDVDASGNDEVEDESDDEDGAENSDDNHESYCNVCQEGGDMICCDACPRVYHLHCHEPPIRRLPRGGWICFECRFPSRKTRTESKQKERSRAKGATSSRSRATKSSRHRVVADSSSEEEEEESPAPSTSRSRRNRAGPRRSRQDNVSEEDAKKSTRKASDRHTKSKSRRNGAAEEESYSGSGSARRKCNSSRTRSSRRQSPENQDESSSGSDVPPPPKKRIRSSKARTHRGSSKRARRQVASLSNEEDDDFEHEKETNRNGKVRGAKESRAKKSRVASSDEEDAASSKKMAKSKRSHSRLAESSSSEDSHLIGKKMKKLRVVVQDIGHSVNGLRASPSQQSSTPRKHPGRRKQRGNYELTACENIIHGLKISENAWPFLGPVDAEKVPDYGKFVSKPIDLQIIKEKLDELAYDDALEFIDDVKLLFSNTKKYNEDKSDVGCAGAELEKEFEHLLATILPQLASAFATS